MVRIGLLIDSLTLKKWQYHIFKYINEHPDLNLEVLIVREEPSKFLSKGSFFYRASQNIDRKIFSVKNDVFSNVDIHDDIHKIPLIEVSGTERKFSYYFPDNKIIEIQKLNLDVLIRFGFGILKGKILNLPTYGVWSLHHGDNDVNRGGPPAFWEVVNKEDVTGITLQRLSEDLDGGEVLKKSFIKTDSTSFYRNKNIAFWAGVELFQLALDEVSKGELNKLEKVIETPLEMYSHPLYKDPNNKVSLKIILSFWWRRILENLEERLCFPQWYLIYKFRKDSTFEKSIFRYKKLYPPKGFDWADPFVIKKEEQFYLFFEELEIKEGIGHISFLLFDKTGKLISENPKIVLNEPYHLSYPFIFMHLDIYYMMPEAADKRELWLYKANNFPFKWEKSIPIFRDKEIYDATLMFHNGIWFLLGTEKLSIGGSRDQYLNIYYTTHLESENWISHPSNPVTIDVRGARPAGKIFRKNDKIYRPTQIGAPKYGYGIQINEIIELSTTKFIEQKSEIITPSWEKNIFATHTLNFVEGFSVMDVQGKI